ncbi:hypothetical protein AMATHDRAFT_146728 [Amanita thiersii Skay4041]|uniref:Alcohol acetyltransferase n=1 Tax=Amanita thiersii Skay4041 TaxID=703135 RepID=A0A2A9NKF9_9AGAR|nr:hypothetical protein AMATHDRAFT_146728 [Amanita thiersii Skay4041]
MYLERRMGDTELSYYLPSRGDGVNDMYLHLGCRTHPLNVARARVCLVWAILRLKHPLLASKVYTHDYDHVNFTYVPPRNALEAVFSADLNLEYRNQTSRKLVDSYLNGPRTLSDDRLSYLMVNTAPALLSQSASEVDCDFLICAAHFIGDGMALHQFANDFFALLCSQNILSDLYDLLDTELLNRQNVQLKQMLPMSLEDRLPTTSGGPLKHLASRVDYQRSQGKLIGGQAFPKQSGKLRNTVVHNVCIDTARTKVILKKCKENGVSVSSALFAVCNIAWARTQYKTPELPSMMYSALNIRPSLIQNPSLHDSYWFLAIGFFNVVLPSFIPTSGDLATTFWHRSREAKKQSALAMKSPMLISRCRQMASERSERAQAWGRMDDGNPPAATSKKSAKLPLFGKASERPPSTALMGLSLLGNLDSIYKHATYPTIQLHTLTTGSRQRSGGMLLFGYTFVGKLWVSLGYDENGFQKDVVESFWKNVLGTIDEFMLH